MLPLLVSLVLPIQGIGSAVAATPPRGPARVTVRLSDSSFAHGQRARVYVELGDTAYLLVLHVNGEGRIRVLFPMRPVEDALVPGGAWYEIPGPDAREAFAVDEREGTGTVLAARSRIPFQFDLLARGDDWDYAEALLFQPTGGEALAAALDIVERLADGRRTEVDATTYIVRSPEGVASRVAEPTAIWPSVRSSPYPGASGNQPQNATPFTDSNGPAPVIINAVCANSYVAEGAVCGSVLVNSTLVLTETETWEYADFSHFGGFFLSPRLFRRPPPVEPPSVSPRRRPAQTLPRPLRPSQVRVKRPAPFPPLPPPRPPVPDANIGPRVRVAAGAEASHFAASRPPVASAPRAMPEAWRRPARRAPDRPAATSERGMTSTTSVRTLGARRPEPQASVPTVSTEATRLVSSVPIGVAPAPRPAPAARAATASSGTTRPTTRAYPHAKRIVRPRSP
jgi:hypothetical protein